jgi:ParB-like chromosome segregation protein Spo0J
MVKLDDIRIDGETQFRDQINQDVVKQYTENMRDGDVFPAIKATFDGKNYWLYDGFHRYFAAHDLGFKDIEVEYKPGTREDAQDLALGANGDHGLQRNNASKRKSVEAALGMERHANKSNLEIAKLCKVSDTFVASIRDPEAKKKQAEKIARHYKKKFGSTEPSGSTEVKVGDVVEKQQLGSTEDPLVDGSTPDAAELLANEMAMQADRELMNNLLDSDEPLKLAHEELTKLNFLNSQLRVRIDSLMNEKNEAIAQCKKLQKQLDKLSKK